MAAEIQEAAARNAKSMFLGGGSAAFPVIESKEAYFASWPVSQLVNWPEESDTIWTRIYNEILLVE